MVENKKELMPGKITTIGILMVISGILMILTVISSAVALIVVGMVFLATIVFSWIGAILCFVAIPYILIFIGGIVDIVFGIRILTGKPPKSLPVWSPIMEIVFGFYLLSSLIGIIILGIGIANLILLLQDDSRMYFYKRSDRD